MNDENKKNIELVMQKNSFWKSVSLGLLILLTGIIIGTASTMIIYENRTRKRMQTPVFPRRGMLKRMERTLNLTPQQVKQIEPILKEHMKSLHEIKMKARPEIEKELTAMKNEIETVLNEEQKKKWRQGIRRLKEKFRSPERRRPHHRRDDRRKKHKKRETHDTEPNR